MKKLSEKVGRIPWIGNKSHVRLFALWQDKKGFIYGTLMCSLPFSPGERDTTTLWMAIAFSLGQGPDKNHRKGIAKRLQFLVKTIEQLIHPNIMLFTACWSSRKVKTVIKTLHTCTFLPVAASVRRKPRDWSRYLEIHMHQEMMNWNIFEKKLFAKVSTLWKSP